MPKLIAGRCIVCGKGDRWMDGVCSDRCAAEVTQEHRDAAAQERERLRVEEL